MRMVSSSGKSTGKRRAICSGLQAFAHRRSCRGPCRRPFQATVGPGTAAPPGATTAPVSRSSTEVRNAAFSASFVGLGRRAARSACHCAVVARYSKPPLRVAALRRNSREIVEAARPSRRATSCMDWPCARRSAISSRSANERYRPESGLADGLNIDGGIPPACLNHRVPTACDTPAAIAASSLAIPAAIAIQNRRRSSRPVAGGRPGENRGARPDRSDRRFRPGIATSFQRVLRRPLESAQYTSLAFGGRCREAGVRPSMGSVGDAYDNAMCESFFSTLECELLARRRFASQAEAKIACFSYIEGFYNPVRLHSALGYKSPIAYEQEHSQKIVTEM